MKKLVFLLAAVVTSALTLTACGGGGSATPIVAKTDANAQIDASTGVEITSAVLDKPFTFDNGVPEFGTVTPTTVTFKQRTAAMPSDPAVPAENPAFTITAGGNSAQGLMEFGSCKFHVQVSTFPAGHPLAAGNVVTVASCGLTASVKGTPADGNGRAHNVVLFLNAARSEAVVLVVIVTPDGRVIVNGVIVVKIDVGPLTGT
jgi:hypothetical protein